MLKHVGMVPRPFGPGGDVAGLPGIDPMSLAGVEVYLRSDQVAGADASSVVLWPDLSGNGRDATAAGANRPTLRYGTSVNGLQTVEFDGNDDLMTGAFPAAPPGIPNTNGYTIYAYINETSLTTGGFNTQMVTGSAGIEVMSRATTLAGYPSDQTYGLRGTGSNRVSFDATQLGWQMLTAVFRLPVGATGAMDLYRDGVQLAPAATNWDITMQGSYLVGNN
jgi:hypothetical protein